MHFANITSHVIFVVLGLHLVYIQAASVQSPDIENYTSLNQKWRSSVSAIHQFTSNSNLKQFIENVVFEASGVEKSNSNCNMTDIKNQSESLVDVISEFSTNAGTYVEMISANVSACSDDGFPKSIACYLSLIKVCKPYVDAINQIASECYPKILAILSALYQDVAKCMH